MTEKRRFLDVWIIESNTVYREVPFTVVVDWVQQGRLLEDDMLRPSGTAEWYRLGDSPEFAPYLPRAEPYRVEDQAEALEPVELDFRWKKPHPDEDDDVDMIPLIDVSLVLLIFFMLTASGVGAAAFIPTPAADYGALSSNAEEIKLNVNLEGDEEPRVPVFSLSIGNNSPTKENSNLRTRDELLSRLKTYLDGTTGPVEVTINAHRDVKSGLVRDLTAALESEPFRSRIAGKYLGTAEK
jgi:biopolymer transport protein ExbD